MFQIIKFGSLSEANEWLKAEKGKVLPISHQFQFSYGETIVTVLYQKTVA